MTKPVILIMKGNNSINDTWYLIPEIVHDRDIPPTCSFCFFLFNLFAHSTSLYGCTNRMCKQYYHNLLPHRYSILSVRERRTHTCHIQNRHMNPSVRYGVHRLSSAGSHFIILIVYKTGCLLRLNRFPQVSLQHKIYLLWVNDKSVHPSLKGWFSFVACLFRGKL